MSPSTAHGKPKGSTGQSRGGKSSSSTDLNSTGSGATSSTAATVALTGTGNAKASAAPPKLSVNGTSVELDSLPGVSGFEAPAPPLEEDIMQLSRLGETVMIQKLFDSGKFDAKYKDEEDITPLHWAAINNQYATCRFLLDAGADVNAKGGQSMATPAMWAAQQNHYYVVHLLLQRGADPSICDIQGYNILHLATFSGNAFLLLLLLHQEIPIDVPDPQGHTPLMWAAYKGFPLCVDLFLRWGANVNALDDGGLTPLHWSLVRGSLPCISKMLDYDADRFAKTKDGKSPSTVASEIGTRNLWHRALKDHGYTPQGELARLPFGLESFVRNKTYVRKWFFFWPFLMIFGGLYFTSSLPVYLGIPATFMWAFVMQLTAQKVGNAAPPEFRDIQRTPFLAGVFAASLFWVIFRWITHVLPGSYQVYPLTNLVFFIFVSTTTYFFITSMLADPGFVPKLSSRNQQREIMESLLDNWKFDEQHFCVMCLNRKPLRSKHCKRCRRCVSKHDHHCPWIDNCVGVNNLRHFVIYILSLEIAILIFLHLVASYIGLLPPATDATCTLLSSSFCTVFSRDSFTIVLSFWAALQLVWVTLLCGVQLVQISRNQTTYEIMRSRHYHPNTPSQAIASAIAAGTTSADATTGQGGPMPPSTATTDDMHVHRHGHSHKGCCSSLRLLLGIDTFMVTAKGAQDQSVNKNPFSQGCLTNCKDFWFDGTPLFKYKTTGSARLAGRDVNYHQMFDVPYHGRSGDSMMVYRSLRADDVV